MKIFTFLALAFLAILTPSTAAQNDNREIKEFQEEQLIPYIKNILTNYKSSIKHISEGKIYLKGEMTYYEDECLYLSNDQEQLALPLIMISTDEQGIYAISDEVHMIICQICNEPYDIENQLSQCPHAWLIKN